MFNVLGICVVTMEDDAYGIWLGGKLHIPPKVIVFTDLLQGCTL